MNTTTTTKVPSPEMDVAQEAHAANLPAIPDTAPINRPGTAPAPVLPTSGFGKVVEAVAAVMAEIHPVEKGGRNTFHDYKYARMQDILQVLTPLMGKHGIVVLQYEFGRQMFDDQKVLAIQYNFVVAHKSGESWISPIPQTGMSPCRTKNGSFDDKSFAKCHTSARKYFLLSLFQVPTEDEADPDNEKRERSQAPVPSPDGHLAPHLIEPVSRDTFDTWADRYLKAVRTSKTLAELDQWDRANDNPLAQMDANEKGQSAYDRILKEFEVLRARLAPATQQQAPIAQQETVQTQQRPKGCPDPEREPDAFVVWAQKRMNAINGADELTLIWEHEITPASDGLFKPDCDSLQEYYDKRLVKIGG